MVSVIGLTGGIASGKSAVSAMLKELGAKVISADLISRQVVEPGLPAWRQIVDEFQESILNKDGTINRKKLGEIVFSDPAKLDRLNKITHPYIIAEIEKLLAEHRASGEGVLVLEAPLLLELGLEHMVDEVWVVAVEPELQLQRLMDRDKLSVREAKLRIEAQMPLEEKLKKADRVIDNSGTLQETKDQLEKIWSSLWNQP
ncbi:MAG: dephospho-CoA kinase [Thermacetogeniaceae bacterium]|jgi:dephospho-CoA kinase|nr:dephospho-CoA kinase [Syntrophomonadaceae bacterium]